MEQLFNNTINNAVGINADFEALIQARDIDKIMTKMDSRQILTSQAMKEYDPKRHKINFRQDKIIKDKKGNRKNVVKRWKLAINYPEYINEIALVFLYGRPPKWGQKSENTDEAFSAVMKLMQDAHFTSKLRQCKRYAGAETQSAMLFRTYADNEGKPQCQIRVLAKSKGDTIYARWDEYENLMAVGWEYYLNEHDSNIRHFNLYTRDAIIYCRMTENGWEVDPRKNDIGKIPVILFQQSKEWAGVESEIEREEYIASRTADTNDYFADPMQVLNANIIKNMPEKDDENKTFIVKGEDVDASKAISIVTWDSAPESKKNEIDWLQNHILSKTFTPNIDFDNMKSLSNVSGKALKQMMILAEIKAQKHQETHDELLNRSANLMKSIIANVLDVKLSEEMSRLEVTHDFQEPFGEDITEIITNLTKAVDSSILSRESAVEQNPYVKDSLVESERIKAEAESDAEAERDIFTQTARMNLGISEGGDEGTAK